jgi:hypothetical protein
MILTLLFILLYVSILVAFFMIAWNVVMIRRILEGRPMSPPSPTPRPDH